MAYGNGYRGRNRVRRQPRRRLPYQAAMDIATGLGRAAGGAYRFGKRRYADVAAYSRDASRQAAFKRRKYTNKPRDGGGSSAQLGFHKDTMVGRKPTLNEVVMKNYNKVVLRFQGVNVLNPAPTDPPVPPGFFRLPNYNTGVGGAQWCPCHVYDLSGIIQSGTSAEPGLQLTLLDGDGSPQWQVLNGQTSTGGAAPAWQVEKRDRALNTNGFAFHEMTQVKLLVYGAKAQPTKYCIEFFTVKAEEVCPGSGVENTNNSAFQNNKAFWADYVKQYVYNPIMDINADSRKKITVIKKVEFSIEPSLTIDEDVQPNSKEVHLNMVWNKMRDYAWTDFTQVIGEDLVSAEYPVEVDLVNVVPRFNQRVWMSIRALNTTVALPESESHNNTPSYDIVLRNYFKLTA